MFELTDTQLVAQARTIKNILGNDTILLTEALNTNKDLVKKKYSSNKKANMELYLSRNIDKNIGIFDETFDYTFN